MSCKLWRWIYLSGYTSGILYKQTILQSGILQNKSHKRNLESHFFFSEIFLYKYLPMFLNFTYFYNHINFVIWQICIFHYICCSVEICDGHVRCISSDIHFYQFVYKILDNFYLDFWVLFSSPHTLLSEK